MYNCIGGSYLLFCFFPCLNFDVIPHMARSSGYRYVTPARKIELFGNLFKNEEEVETTRFLQPSVVKVTTSASNLVKGSATVAAGVSIQRNLLKPALGKLAHELRVQRFNAYHNGALPRATLIDEQLILAGAYTANLSIGPSDMVGLLAASHRSATGKLVANLRAELSSEPTPFDNGTWAHLSFLLTYSINCESKAVHYLDSESPAQAVTCMKALRSQNAPPRTGTVATIVDARARNPGAFQGHFSPSSTLVPIALALVSIFFKRTD
jgi:hypothetical protein